MLSVALAMAGSALMTHAVQDLALNRSDLDRTAQAAAMSGAQFQATADVIRSRVGGPYHWGFSGDAGVVDAAAELEADKLDPQSAAALDDHVFTAFGVKDPGTLKARLLAASAAGPAFAIGELDPAPLWRACGGSFVSPLGLKQTFVYAPRVKPGDGSNPTSWHVGEAWRIRTVGSDGWAEDRIVRFTGDAQRPAAIVVRQFRRSGVGWGACEAVLESLFAAG